MSLKSRTTSGGREGLDGAARINNFIGPSVPLPGRPRPAVLVAIWLCTAKTLLFRRLQSSGTRFKRRMKMRHSVAFGAKASDWACGSLEGQAVGTGGFRPQDMKASIRFFGPRPT